MLKKQILPTISLCLLSSATFTTALTTTSSANAEEAAESRFWEAGAELGWVSTGGNSETSSLNAKFRYSRTVEKTTLSSRLETIRTEENETETANKYLVEVGLKWQSSDKHYLLGTLLQEDDKFSQYDYQTTATLGYGRPILQTDKHQLDITLGPGFRYSKFSTAIAGETSDEEVVFRLGGTLNSQLSKTATFTQTLTIDAGEEQTISKSESALSSQVADQLAMKTSITIRHNSDPLLDDASTDRETSVTLVYTW